MKSHLAKIAVLSLIGISQAVNVSAASLPVVPDPDYAIAPPPVGGIFVSTTLNTNQGSSSSNWIKIIDGQTQIKVQNTSSTGSMYARIMYPYGGAGDQVVKSYTLAPGGTIDKIVSLAPNTYYLQLISYSTNRASGVGYLTN